MCTARPHPWTRPMIALPQFSVVKRAYCRRYSRRRHIYAGWGGTLHGAAAETTCRRAPRVKASALRVAVTRLLRGPATKTTRNVSA